MVNLNKMYDGVVNSPETYLTQNLAADATIIYVADSSVFGSLPNLAVIGTDQNAETILIKSKRSDGGLEVQRAIEGPAKRWEKTTAIARNFTNYDYNQVKSNIEKLNTGKQDSLTAGSNIKITNGRISATDTKYNDTQIKKDIAELQNSQLSKASQTEAESGADNTKYMTPQATKQAIQKLSPKQDLSDYAMKKDIKTKLSEMVGDSTHRTVTDAEKNKISSLPENFKIPNPPLPIVDLKANIINNKIHLTWINPNDDKYSGVKIIKNLNNTPTSISDGTQVYSGNGNSYYDDIVPDKLIRYRGFAFNSDSELNSDLGQAIQVLTKFDDTIGAPGNRFLLNGNMQQGWFGEVLTSDFINGEELARLIGLTAGKSQYSNEPWLKFAYMGKIEFIAKKTFRYSISWNDINNVNAVTGNKTINIKGKKYKVRLIKGKTEGMQNDRNSQYGAINYGSEWNKLLLPIHEGAPSNWNNSQASNNQNVMSPTQDWEVNYTDDDLLMMNNNGTNGCYSWCQEYGNSTSTRLYRGQYGVAYSQCYDSARNGNLYGWRPVLELIG